MVVNISKSKNLKIGDLVTHVLYGKEWIGIIVDILKEETKDTRRKKVIVQIQPGTKYDGFFDQNTRKRNRISSNLGYISINWLFKLELKNDFR